MAASLMLTKTSFKYGAKTAMRAGVFAWTAHHANLLPSSRLHLHSHSLQLSHHHLSTLPKLTSDSKLPLPHKHTGPRILASHCMQSAPGKSDHGEDAFFIEQDAAAGVVAGVADGVGGWSNEGIDAGLYSRELMANAKDVAKKSREPKKVLSQAYNRMRPETKGSCTACIVVFSDDKLSYANLGDSGLFGWRAGESQPFIRSQEQQHRWNCPFQLGHDTGDEPESANEASVTVQKGDIIILATDGFFDNLYNHDITKIVTDFVAEHQKRVQALRQMQKAWPPTEKSSAEYHQRHGMPPATASSSSSSSSSHLPSADSIAATLAPNGTPASASAASSATRPTSASSARSFALPAAALHTRSDSASSLNSVSSSASSSSSSASAASVAMLDESSLKGLARHLVDRASAVAADKHAPTPFADAAKKQGRRFIGGKPDDITVVVAQVMYTNTSKDHPPTTASATAAAE